MKATKSVQAGAHDEKLEQVKLQFALWRQGRQRGARVPVALWAEAVSMAREHDLQRIAQELRLDPERLKKRLERVAKSAPSGAVETRFVDLFALPAPSAAPTFECTVEMENAQGGKMRISLKGHDALASLTSAFWRAP